MAACRHSRRARFSALVVDLVRRERFVLRLGVQRAQQSLRRVHRGGRAGDAEDMPAVGDFRAQPQLELPQVFVEGAGEVSEAFVVLRLEGVAVG